MTSYNFEANIMNLKDYYKVGFIMRPHGLKGEVTVSTDSEASIIWEDLKSAFLEKDNKIIPYFIEGISSGSNKVFIKFEDINTPEQAALLKGASIFLPKESRPKLHRNEFYNEDVIDFEVIDKHSVSLGKVKDVEQHGPNRLLIVDHDNSEIMIPVNGPFIIKINRSKKIINVSLPEGFLDI